MTATCTFKKEYFDYQSQENEVFSCDIECIEGKDLCLFHDECFLKEYPEKDNEVIEKLHERIENSNRNKMSLKCIGYSLPYITLKEDFIQQVYFNYCKFQGRADFIGAKFSAKADFIGSTFKETADFRKATFKETAYFSGAKFSDQTYFSCEFKGITYFNYVTFEKPNETLFEVEICRRFPF